MEFGIDELPDPSTVDSATNGWIVPATDTERRRRYELDNGRWFLKEAEAIIEHSDPVILPDGRAVTFEEAISVGVQLQTLPPLPE